jgi:hypothetical protein
LNQPYLSFLFLALALSSQVGHVVNDTDGGATGKRAAAIATLTSGIVSLLKVRGSLADRVAGLGHVSTIFDLLKRSRDHDPRGLGVAKMSCFPTNIAIGTCEILPTSISVGVGCPYLF